MPSTRVTARRRSFTVLVAFTLVVLVVLLRPGRDDAGNAVGAPSSSDGGATSAPASTGTPSGATTEGVPAWLAWMPGGFPAGFRRRVAGRTDLGATVVVAGDTLWMTASHDASGRIIDRPDPPYAIPIDAFAVDPGTFAPFVPPEDRTAVVEALRGGEAVLGRSSASLRRIGVGGSLSYGAVTIRVGAVVRDQDVGWSEILVSRPAGARLGIAHDRYLLALGTTGTTLAGFAGEVRAMLPAGSLLRTVRPGGTRFVRVASGVDPPVVMKEAFGEFAAHPEASDPAMLQMDPSWYDAHIQTERVPIFSDPVTCNRALFPMLIGALRDVRRAGLAGEIHTYSGCYAARTVARSDIAPPSQHAYGAAIDINAPENPFGSRPTMDPRIVKIFERWGFDWGGDFLIPDGMHFEYGLPPPA